MRFSLFAFIGLMCCFQAEAQPRVWYVNNVVGSNLFDGGSPIVGSGTRGPKRTITAALESSGKSDTIVVAGTGVAYGANSGESPIIQVGSKNIFIIAQGGIVEIHAGIEISNSLSPPSNVVKMGGEGFILREGLWLARGELRSPDGTLTIGTRIVRTGGRLVGRPKYLGLIDYSYFLRNPSFTGDEFPASRDTSVCRNLAVNGSMPLTLSNSITVNGVLETRAHIDLRGNTLRLQNDQGEKPQHTLSADIFDGWIDIDVRDSVSIAAQDYLLPRIRINSKTPAGVAHLVLSAARTGSIKILGDVDVKLILNGRTSFTNPDIDGELVNIGSGVVSVDRSSARGTLFVRGTVKNTGQGYLEFPGILASGIQIQGDLILDSKIVFSSSTQTQNRARITIGNIPCSIAGTVRNQVEISGTADAAHKYQHNGVITFQAVHSGISIDQLSNEARIVHSVGGSGLATIGNNGNIRFVFSGLQGGALTIRKILNSAQISLTGGQIGTVVQSGNILFENPIAAASEFGEISNTSSYGSSLVDPSNGRIDFNPLSTGDFSVASVTSSGAGGGAIQFGKGSFVCIGDIVNARTDPGVHILWGGADSGRHFRVDRNLINTGAGSIHLEMLSTGENVIGGRLENSGSGTIRMSGPPTANLVIGSMVLSGGILDLSGANSAASIMAGNVELVGGTINFGNGVRSFHVRGSTNIIGNSFGGVTFTNGKQTTLIFETPVPTSKQTIIIRQSEISWPGSLAVSNTTGLTDAVRFTGGNIRLLGTLSFLRPGFPYGILLDGTKLFVLGNSEVNAFQNRATYNIQNEGAIVMSGTMQEIGGDGFFGDLEINSSGIVTFANNTGPITTNLFLRKGIVHNTASSPTGSASNVLISNNAIPPTIVVDEGRFASGAGPTFQSSANVTYVGEDKHTSTELPLLPSKLINLKVATTSGASPGKGVITLSTSITVNGKLTVNQAQTLMIGADKFLTLHGDSAVIEGNIANRRVADSAAPPNVLVLDNQKGTIIVGSGVLCDILVSSGSLGNKIDGPRAIINRLLGGNGAYGGGDDFDNTASAANGSIKYGSGTASLTVTFGTAYGLNGTHFKDLTTASSGNTFTLGASVGAAGDITHAAGNVNLGAFTYTHRGTAPAITGGATITGTGTLKFTVAASTLTVSSTAATIAANVEVSLPNSTDDFTAPSGVDMTISGNLTLTKGRLQTPTSRTLTLTGTTFTVGASGSVGTTGTGTMRLNAATPPLTWSYSGDPTVNNFKVSNDVVLSGSGTSLTVSGTLTHDGGKLDFGTRDLTASGTYVRSGSASYAATTGYFVFSGTAFNQGTTAVSIPNLRLASGAVTVGSSGVVTVTTALDVQLTDTFTITNTSVVTLAVATGATVNYRSNAFDVAPAYAGTITLVADDAASGTTLDATVWPSTLPALVTTLRVASTTSVTRTVKLPGSRTVNTTLDLRYGVLDLDGNTLTIADNATIRRRHTGSVSTAAAGSAFSFGNKISVIYEPNTFSSGGDFMTGAELPSTVNNLTFTRTGNVANFLVTNARNITVNGTLAIRNDLTTTGTITARGDVTIANDAGLNATTPVTTFTAALKFAGGTNQTFTLNGNRTVGNLSINKTSSSNTVTLFGGNLTCAGTVTFVNGLVLTDNNILILTGAGGAAQGFDRTGVSGGNVSHVVGNVRRPGVGILRQEFPVGTSTLYRPVAITPVATFGGVDVTVTHVDTRPTGIVGLPIIGGIVTDVETSDIARYPGFYWSISSNVSIGQASEFDLEMTAAGFSDFDLVKNVRIIRRIGTATDIGNEWLLQGLKTATAYDNYTVGTSPVLTVVNVNSTGGIRPEGGTFTYGLKSTLFVVGSGIGNQTLPDGARLFKRKLTSPAVFGGNTQALSFSASSSNASVATASLTATGDTLVVRGLVAGTSTITVTASNPVDGQISTTFKAMVTGVDPVALIPTEFALEQNFPNPFNPSTTIRFALPKEAPVTLVIYNMLGVPVRTLVNGENLNAARHQVAWDGKDDAGITLPSGVYLYRISAGTFQTAKKMTLLR